MRLESNRRTPRDLTWWLFSALVGAGTLIRIPQLSHGLYESYRFRQAQTAFVIQKYASDGIDLLSTPLPVFGRDSNVPLELPLFQALGALLVHTGLSPETAARLLALISFQVVGVMLSIIVFRWHGMTVAVTGLALFEFLPFGLYWGTASLIDFFLVALALTMVYFLDRWFNGGSTLTLLAGSLAAVLAFLVKPTPRQAGACCCWPRRRWWCTESAGVAAGSAWPWDSPSVRALG